MANPTFAAAGKETVDGQPFIGAPPTALFNKEVESADYLDKHEPLIHQQWNGGLPQFRTDPTAEIVEFINSAVGGLGPEKLGRVILVGMSSGGRNAATVADQIKGRRLFTYVAAIDAVTRRSTTNPIRPPTAASPRRAARTSSRRSGTTSCLEKSSTARFRASSRTSGSTAFRRWRR